ncbi:MAG: hypothetical protein ACI8Z5_000480 [Lentimonas sp.]|jgi:hypothetical protein
MLKPHDFLREALLLYSERLAEWIDALRGAERFLVRATIVDICKSESFSYEC